MPFMPPLVKNLADPDPLRGLIEQLISVEIPFPDAPPEERKNLIGQLRENCAIIINVCDLPMSPDDREQLAESRRLALALQIDCDTFLVRRNSLAFFNDLVQGYRQLCAETRVAIAEIRPDLYGLTAGVLCE